MSFEEWYDQHFGSPDEKEQATASAMLAEIDPERLDYSATGDPVASGIGSVFQSVRQAPEWAAKKIYKGATRTDIPPAPPGFNPFSFKRAFENMEGPSAREQEAAAPPPPYQTGGGTSGAPSWSLDRAVQNFPRQVPELYDQLKNQILPPGFNVQRGIDSAMAPVKWLGNQVRQTVLPDEALEEIKRNPYSINAMQAYVNAAISLSMGEGGERIPFDASPGAVPEHVWNKLNIAPPYNDPKIKVDNAGNYYEYQGSHSVVDPETGQETRHIIAKPVDSTLIPPDELHPLTPDQPNPFAKFLQEQYPEGTSGSFTDPDTLPPGELSKGPSKPDKGEGGSWLDKHLSPEDKAKYDALDKLTGGELNDFLTPSKPLKPEPGSAMDDLQKQQEKQKIFDEWAKKHGGKHFDEPPKPAEPGTPEYLNETLDIMKNFFQKHGVDYGSPEEPPVDPLDENQPPGNPRTHLYWSDTYQKMMPTNWGKLPERWLYKPPPEHGGNNL